MNESTARAAAEAIEQALATGVFEPEPETEPSQAVTRVYTGDLRARAERERQLDEAMADVVEVVRRQRQRLGRRVCTANDGGVIRQICALLRGMSIEVSADNDPSWGDGQ